MNTQPCPRCQAKKMKERSYTHVHADGSAERVIYLECTYCGMRVDVKRYTVKLGEAAQRGKR